MITGVVLTKNEEKNIVDCLESLSFCDEVIVVDDNSIDRTQEVARLQKARVITRPLAGDFSKQRNFALSQAKNSWVLFVDADERVSEPLKEEIVRVVKNEEVNGYFLPREDELFGRRLTHGELQGIKLLRLGQKNKGEWIGVVHERWEIKEPTGTLKNPLVHIPHTTLSEFLSEINFYTTLRANELKKQGVTSSFLTVLLYTKGKFFQTYILKLGFLDGMPGFVLSIMMSFHSFLVRGKLWLLYKHE